MATRRTSAAAARAADDAAAPAAGSVATPDAGIGTGKADFTEFVWGKLNDIDGHLKDLAEKYGRLDEKLTGVSASVDAKTAPIQKSMEKLEAKVSKLETTIRWATAIVVVTAALASGGLTIYKMIESHVSVSWH
ncbi:hypothetical protein BN2476_350285 [Paraburkholderia piptadeniae]|uniref:Uncharacterized protein n=1 Tax=Paraburkholderia piptadeniae TaxID=1701573 RepID=A0A1N7S8S3_9BURK|nr:hypothetical protein [Paraburkholderia piptadeniae]SIT43774.1 hypothetical protein BN2476_350285 [Paraburkholderia piptadeniae]